LILPSVFLSKILLRNVEVGLADHGKRK